MPLQMLELTAFISLKSNNLRLNIRETLSWVDRLIEDYQAMTSFPTSMTSPAAKSAQKKPRLARTVRESPAQPSIRQM